MFLAKHFSIMCEWKFVHVRTRAKPKPIKFSSFPLMLQSEPGELEASYNVHADHVT